MNGPGLEEGLAIRSISVKKSQARGDGDVS
jgi:hypothetical protein